VKDSEGERHDARRTMNTPNCDETHADRVCEKAEVWASEERDHVDQRHGSGSQTSLCECQNLEAEVRRNSILKNEAENIHCDVGQLHKDMSAAPRTQISMTVEEIGISEMLRRPSRDILNDRRSEGKDIRNTEEDEDAASSNRIFLCQVHISNELKGCERIQGKSCEGIQEEIDEGQ
jgi:hypothetical protein